jgi:hypothetical protein
MRLGLLALDEKWDRTEAEKVILRFKTIEDNVRDLQHPPYGHIYVSQDSGMTLNLAASGTTYILTGASDDYLNGFTFADDKLTCPADGYYCINYSVSFSVNTVPRHIEITVVKNDTWQSQVASHVDMQTANSKLTVFGATILLLRRGDYIQVGARCPTNTAVMTYEHFDLTTFRVRC